MTDPIGVYPHQGCCHHTALEMVGDRKSIAGLALTASDLLLYLPEAGFYFQAGPIEFNDLLHCEHDHLF